MLFFFSLLVCLFESAMKLGSHSTRFGRNLGIWTGAVLNSLLACMTFLVV